MPGAVTESDSEEEMKVEEEWTAVRPKNKCSPESVPAFIATENKSNHQPPIRTTEEVSGGHACRKPSTSFPLQSKISRDLV